MSILQIFIDDTGGSPALHADPTNPTNLTRTHRTSSRLTNQPTRSVPSQRRTFVHQGEIFHFRSSSSAPLSFPSLLPFRTFSNISSFLPAASVNVLRLRSTVQHPAADLSSSLAGKQAPFPRPVNNVRRVVCCCVCLCVRACVRTITNSSSSSSSSSTKLDSLSPKLVARLAVTVTHLPPQPHPPFFVLIRIHVHVHILIIIILPPSPSYTALQATHTHTFVLCVRWRRKISRELKDEGRTHGAGHWSPSIQYRCVRVCVRVCGHTNTVSCASVYYVYTCHTSHPPLPQLVSTTSRFVFI